VVSDTPDLGRYERVSLGLDRDFLLMEERISENLCFLTDLLNALQLPTDLRPGSSSPDELVHGFKSLEYEVGGCRFGKAHEELLGEELPRNSATSFLVGGWLEPEGASGRCWRWMLGAGGL
jgi:hypothetical protein